jgi:hypothetical protein
MHSLEVTLAFSRKEGEVEVEDFHHTFVSNESLDPILEKFEMFLTQMGFVLDGKQLSLVDTEDKLVYNDNVKAFPTPFNQE